MYLEVVARRRKGEEPIDRVSTHVYLPRDLYEAVAREAQKADRSVNAEITQAVRSWIADKGIPLEAA